MFVIDNCTFAPLSEEEEGRVLLSQQEALLEIADRARDREAWARADAAIVRDRLHRLYP